MSVLLTHLFYCFIVCMCVLMCNFVSYFVCVILCIFVFLCDILLPSGVINDDKSRLSWASSFFSRVSTAILTRDINIGILSVRPSVCHAPVLYQNGLTYHRRFFILVFQVLILYIFAKSDGVTPYAAGP